MLPVDCGHESLTTHGNYYDAPVFRWSLRCGDLEDQAGTFRVSAILPSGKIGCQEAVGPACTPCLPDRETCGRLEEGLASGYLPVSGDRPLGVGYRLLCHQTPLVPALIFYLEQDGASLSCTSDPYGKTTCSQPGCSLDIGRATAPTP